MKIDSLLSITVGLCLRVVCVCFGVGQYFSDQKEFVSPLTSRKRAIECLHLYDHGILPYNSDVCHQPPLVILLTKFVPLQGLYLGCDLLTAIMLYYVATSFSTYALFSSFKHVVQVIIYLLEKSNKIERQLTQLFFLFLCGWYLKGKQAVDLKYYWKEVKPLLLTDKSFESIPFVVVSIYLFNPYSIVALLAQSSIVLNNFCVSFLLLSIIKGWFGLAGCLVSIATYLSPYNMVLMFPLLLMSKEKSESIVGCLLYPLTMVTLSSASLLYSSYSVFQSWDFLSAVYGFTFAVGDLSPNMSLFWYFFLEMFHHFRLFFLWVFQLHVFVYVPPLTMVFRNRPIFLFYLFISLITLCKSYSNVGDMILPLAILPLWSCVYRYMRNVLFIGALFIVSSVLSPVMWYLWIYAGSGNANFFYAVTLAYSCAQIFLLSDILYAVMRYDYHLRNGLFPKTDDGKQGNLVLK